MGLGLMSMISGMFGGAGEIGTTPIEQGVGYSPEIPMSTGVDTGMNVPAQPTDASGGVSPSLWQSIGHYLSGTSDVAQSDPNAEIDPKTGKPKDTRADDLAKAGKFLSSVGGMQANLQNSRLAQQMIQQHVNQPGQQGKYVKPEDMATRLLMQQGLL
jgi:hypothetical protein